MLIAVASVKGSPGATTLALGMAALWPRPGAVLVECDAAGGDLAVRFGHHPDHPDGPGLSGLAAATLPAAPQPQPPASTPPGPIQPATAGGLLAGFAQRLSVGADVVLAAPGPAAAAAVRTLTEHGITTLRQAAATRTVVLDVGRLDAASPSLPLAAAADHLLLVARPEPAEQHQVGARLAWLQSLLSGRLWLAPAGDGRLPAAELTSTFDVPVIGVLPHHRWAAAALTGRMRVPNWRRLSLGTAIGQIAVRLADLEPIPDLGTVPHPPVVAPVITAPRTRTADRRPGGSGGVEGGSADGDDGRPREKR
ncbi:hypothetical protein [Phytohabitans aurantiacus]|uniref:MinD-like ATPase involved in chromosome partitioning or flagellar assembly n=1 Tax=Phytohabitans aurantiacus TaxID=3016789 RepID=A0ABQ5QY16_9ACTN|nr:hypothetical protein [Phytohabitans aurantiacus]GLH98817.1 hypothetical protein Pa4123_40920 [Phytohabitans aurantiacus]